MLASAGAAAQTTAPAQAIVVTGSREPLAADRLAADVAVIDGDTVRDSRADSLADLLRREAGVQLSRSGGPGQSTGIFVRGAASQQSIVLVDGVRVGSATLGYTALETLSLQQVDRIEVLRGPGSSLYGADAVGGVVQIHTKNGVDSPDGAAQGEARLAAGGYGSREAAGALRGRSGAVDYAVGLSSERSRGVSALRPGDAFGNYNPDADGYRLEAGELRLGLRPAAGHRVGLTLLRSHLDTQYDSSRFVAPTFAQDASPDFRTRQTTEVAALDWRGTLAAGVVGSARASRSVDDASNGSADDVPPRDRFRTRREQLSAQLAWQTGVAGQFVGAIETQRDQGRSTSYTSDVERRNHALVAELTGSAGAWSWQADARRDDSSDFGAVDTGRIGGTWRFTPGWRLRALAGTTFRAPSFNDLYYPGYGVATLRPERGRSVEAGVGWSAAASEAALTVWRNRVRDLIGYESDPSLCPSATAYAFGCAANTSRAKLQGATVSAASRVGALSAKAQLDWLQARDDATGARLARRAAHQATLSADWTEGDWRFGASVLRLGARPDGGAVLPAETTVDVSASWRFMPAWQLQAKLLNATDRDTQPARDYQGPGRQGWLVLRWEPAS